MTTTILLAAVLWALWRFLAAPAAVTAASLEAAARGLVPAAASLAVLRELQQAPAASKRQAIAALAAGRPHPPQDLILAAEQRMRDEATPDQMVGYLAADDAATVPEAQPLGHLTVRELRALARSRGYRGAQISRGSKQWLLLLLGT